MKHTLSLTVPELDCADEARQIESALARLAGVSEIRTAVSARKAIVSYDADRVEPAAIHQAIRDLGMSVTDAETPEGSRRKSVPELIGWGFVSLIAFLTLAGVVGERTGLLESAADRIPPWISIAAVVAGGYPIFRNVVRALRNRSVTSHALMTLGIVGALGIGQYSAAAVIVFFMRLADFIEGYTTERSRQAIKELLKSAPETATVEREGQTITIDAGQVSRGEIVLVRPGDRIPVDGTVVDGRASVNQASITGESVPAEKQPGDQVFAATICERGALRVRTERVGRDTTFGQIVGLVEQAEAAKAPVQRFADRFTAYYIPVVVGVALVTYLIGRNASAAVATVLVACSCAIAMATPVTVLAAVGRAAKRGIVIKGGRYLEALAKIDTLVMDKTGTITIGRPEVTDVVTFGGDNDDDLFALAATVEGRSEHPLAAGITRAAAARGVRAAEVADFHVYPGEGVAASVGGNRIACGTERLMARFAVDVPQAVQDRVETLARDGKSIVLVARGAAIVGLIALADTIRPEVRESLAVLRQLGLSRLVILSGDRGPVVAAVARELGVDYQAELLPEQKIQFIKRQQEDGSVVAMVGDGINDAPALAQADVGIAMGVAGTDAAIEAAHVALMADDLRVVPEAVALGRRAFATIKQNLWFTAGYNALGILLAALGWLPPVLAAAAQALPDVAVMLNSSRLLRPRR